MVRPGRGRAAPRAGLELTGLELTGLGGRPGYPGPPAVSAGTGAARRW